MAELAALPLFTDAITADCGHLSDAEFGLYTRMLILVWRSPGCKIPNDHAWLARKLNRAVELFAPILDEFFDCTGNYIFQKRLLKEWNYVMAKRQKSSVAANMRWNKEKEPCGRNAKAHAKPDSKNSAPNKPMNNNDSGLCVGNAPSPSPLKKDDEERNAGAKSPFQKIYDFGVNLFPQLAPQNTSAIRQWIEAGVDIEKDVLPEIKRVYEKGVKPRSWGLFTQDVADAHARRIKPMPEGNPQNETTKRSSSPSARPSKSAEFKRRLAEGTLADLEGIAGSEESAG